MNIVNKDSKNTFTRMCIGEAIIKLLKDTDLIRFELRVWRNVPVYHA